MINNPFFECFFILIILFKKGYNKEKDIYLIVSKFLK